MNITNYIIGILQMLLIAVFGSILFSKRIKRTLWRVVVLVIAPTPIHIANMLHKEWLNFLVSIFVGLLLMFLLYKSRWYWLALAGMTSTLALGFCEGATAFIATMILKDKMLLIVANPITRIVIVLISILLFAILVWALRLLISVVTISQFTVYLSSNIGVLALLCISVITASYTIYVDSIADFDSRLSIFGFIILLSLIVIDAYFIFGNEHDRKHYRMQNEILTMKYREDQLAALIAQQEGYLDKLKSTAHDFKKHLYTIQKLTKQDSTHELEPATQRYIHEMIQTVEETAYYSEVNNKVLNVILSTTKDKCGVGGIEYTASIKHHDFSFMAFKDVCTLFANAIDNAYDACMEIEDRKKKRFLDINIIQHGEMIMVKIVNSNSHQVKYNGRRLLTSKPDENEHGYGLRNMRSIAQSYGGDVFFEHGSPSALHKAAKVSIRHNLCPDSTMRIVCVDSPDFSAKTSRLHPSFSRDCLTRIPTSSAYCCLFLFAKMRSLLRNK